MKSGILKRIQGYDSLALLPHTKIQIVWEMMFIYDEYMHFYWLVLLKEIVFKRI